MAVTIILALSVLGLVVAFYYSSVRQQNSQSIWVSKIRRPRALGEDPFGHCQWGHGVPEAGI